MQHDTQSQTLAYTVHHGRITTPGRYEGEPAYTPFFHSLWLDGLHDQCDDDVGLFWLDPGDYELFPELAGFTFVVLFESGSGHVSATALNHLEEPN